MRSPSSKVLKNRCNIYTAPQNLMADSAGGMVFTYPSMPTIANEPCSIQAGAIRELIDEQDRITQYLEYKLMFARQLPVTPRDKITYVDPLGITRILFAEVQRDEAGRGAAFVVHATEKI